MRIMGHKHPQGRLKENGVFSRARWCFRQSAWPARRHARMKRWRARESTACWKSNWRFGAKEAGQQRGQNLKFQVPEEWRLAREFQSHIGGAMNSRADSYGRQKYQSSRNVLPGVD